MGIREIESLRRIKKEQRLQKQRKMINQEKKKILNHISDEIKPGSTVLDAKLAEITEYALQEIQYYLQELQKDECIKIIESPLIVYAENFLVEKITPKGYMVLQGKISLSNTRNNQKVSTNKITVRDLNINGGYNQVFSSYSTQNISISNTKLEELVSQLSQYTDQSSLDEDDKQEVIETTDKLIQLSVQDSSNGLSTRIKRRLDTLNEIFKPANELYNNIKPILIALYELFKINFPI